jgi:hypothetical protein
VEFGFDLVLLDQGTHGTLYTFHVHGHDEDEYDKFCSYAARAAPNEYEKLELRLDRMLDKRGFRKNFFKTEKYDLPECAYHNKGLLRWYCLRYSSSVLIVGDGGIKPPDARALQEVPRLKDAFERIQHVQQRIQSHLQIAGSVRPELREDCLQLTDDQFTGSEAAFTFPPPK